ncbi:hypothetical protein bcgnr5390_64220 [Bacillus luti]
MSVNLQVNVIGQLMLFKNSTFKDAYVFLDELIQNAQRANAKNVYVRFEVENNLMKIENDGDTLKDPQVLFRVAESGWEDKVMKSENPFGMGFFSILTVSDYIEVYSGSQKVIFDVNHVIETKDTSILVEESEIAYEGFKLVLHNIDYDRFSSWQMRERLKRLGQFVHELDIHVDGEKQEKKELTETDGSIYATSIEDDDIKGWIALQEYGFFGSLKVFYKGREVTKLDGFPYLTGDLHISDKTLTLRQPDRKDIIEDEKYDKFKEIVHTYASIIAEEAILKKDHKNLQTFKDAISYYADKEQLRQKMEFVVYESKDSRNYLKKITQTLKKTKGQESTTLQECELFLRKEEEALLPMESEEDVSTFSLSIEEKSPKARGVVEHASRSSSSHEEGYTERPKIPEERLDEREAFKLIDNQAPTFWMNFEQIVEYEKEFLIADHYSLRLIIAENPYEEKILGTFEDMSVLHISSLKETITLEGELKKVSFTDPDKRAIQLLDMVSRMFGFKENVFRVGELTVFKSISLDVLGQKFESEESGIVAVFNKKENKVFVDYKVFQSQGLILSDELTVQDFQFLLKYLPVLLQQMRMIPNFSNVVSEAIGKSFSGDLHLLALNTLAEATLPNVKTS